MSQFSSPVSGSSGGLFGAGRLGPGASAGSAGSVGSVGSAGSVGSVGVAGRADEARSGSPVRRGEDRVELSGPFRLLNVLRERAGVRQDLVERVRSEIAAGTYETAERLDLAIDALSEDLRG